MYNLFVISNKGGVGKTTIAVNLAYFLSQKGYKTGLLDVDIHGPNVPKMLSIKKNVEVKGDKIIPIKFNENLYIMSIDFLMQDRRAVIWRGPLKTKLISQFINDVEWPELDFLIVDLPPGTGDETITIMQLLNKNSGSIIVSTPQSVSILDAKRAIDTSKEFKIPIVGIIENMSNSIFGSGTVEKLAKEEKINFLGAISLDKSITEYSDKGIPFISRKTKSSKEFEKIIKNIMDYIDAKSRGAFKKSMFRK